jgi:hypothetical protein
LLNNLFLDIVNENSRNRQSGLPSPYYSGNAVLEAVIGIDTEKIDFTQFPGSSYTLERVILMIARRNGRDILDRNWRKLSHIRFREFEPDKLEDTFVWHTKEGVNRSAFPKATQSWAELTKEANDISSVPELYLEYLHVLRFFILVLPHRANKLIISLLDQN